MFWVSVAACWWWWSYLEQPVGLEHAREHAVVLGEERAPNEGIRPTPTRTRESDAYQAVQSAVKTGR